MLIGIVLGFCVGIGLAYFLRPSTTPAPAPTRSAVLRQAPIPVLQVGEEPVRLESRRIRNVPEALRRAMDAADAG